MQYIHAAHYSSAFEQYTRSQNLNPLLLLGDALTVLKTLPSESIDCCMTSPPYWGKRQYANGGLGLESEYGEFIDVLVKTFAELRRVLKSTGSFWLNIGDTYYNKTLAGIPWRIALRLMDEQGWVMRNNVIWHKVKGGPDNTTDRLRNLHENVFHFTKIPRGYFYDVDAVRSNPKKAKVVNGAIVSATGVTGVRYRRQIELSTSLAKAEKERALAALEEMLGRVSAGEIADFRMIIRKQQRTTHSDSKQVSGRARELEEKGFYFLRYHPKGSKPSDVWEVIPEDSQKRGQGHYAAYPEDLCLIPILATCPRDGIVLDPFCGTGTTLLVAKRLDRQSVGVDISETYLKLTHERTWTLL